MATLDQDDANILDAETINWRLIVYPVLVAAIILIGGFGYYYYQLSQREDLEAKAHAALVDAKTPADWQKVADQYPTTDQATIALLSAAEFSFDKQDYAAAADYYKKALFAPGVNEMLGQAARIGYAASLEASGKVDDAIGAYLVEARMGAKSPFASYAYYTAAQLYEARGDKDNERKVLTEAASLDPDSPFVKQAQQKLKELNLAPVSMSVPPSPAPAK